MLTKYIIISPVKDEEENIENTLRSVVSQGVKPYEWIIVNDGSKDRTEEIVKSYIAQYPWIRIINLPDRGCRLPGKGIVDAFYAGFENIYNKDWNYVVKLDCDLSFGSNYFNAIFMEFENNPKLGIASGKTYLPVKGNINKFILEYCPDNCTRGPSKIYKRECFEKIGGIRRERGWDTLDDVAAMVKGYEVKSYKEYKVIHHRPIGTRTGTDRGIKSRLDMGSNCYYLGYHPLFMLFKCLKSVVIDKPYIIAGLAMFYSYLNSMIRHKPRIEDKNIIAQLQKVQLNRLMFRDISRK